MFLLMEQNLSLPMNLSESQMLQSSARELIHFPRLHFLQSFKNPCFWGPDPRKGRHLKCLPYVFLIGFSKCATTDLFSKLKHHQHIVPGLFKEMPFWTDRQDNQLYLRDYMMNFMPLARINEFLFTSSRELVARSYIHKQILSGQIKPNKTLLPSFLEKDFLKHLITIDATVANIFEAHSWEDDPVNKKLLEPKILAPHRIHHIYAEAKFIVIMRNPVDRTFSDFKYHTRNRLGADYFHKAVVKGIQWWKHCVASLPTYRCAYGWNYTGTVVENLGSGTTDWGDASSTGRANGAGRMRTSIYVIYIKKWLEVFPKQNFLFLKTEDYSRNTKGTLYNEVFSFLDLDNISHEALKKLEQSISKERKNTNIHSNVEMFSETRQLLEKFYEPYNTELSALLKDVKYTWNDR